MGIVDTGFRTISCNGPNCKKTVTFALAQEKQTFDLPENVWLKSMRMVQTLDARKFVYCGDVCEAEAIATGVHNLPEPKRIIDNVATSAQVQAAADAAKAQEAATQAIKAGGPVTLR
jgi:hypothetical protein